MIPKWIASINLNGKDNYSDEWDSISCVDLIGDDLARLKVTFTKNFFLQYCCALPPF